MSVLCRLNPYGDGVMYGKLVRVLFILLILHSCTTGMRFCVTLDALEHGASSFEVGAMLASVALFPAFGAIAAGRWLDRSGPRPSLALAIFCAASAGAATLIFPTKTAGLWPLFSACVLVGTAFMLTNTVVQRLTGDVSTNETRALAFTLLSIVTALSGLLTPIITGYMIEHFGFASFYCWVAGAPIFVGLMCLLPFMRHVLPAGGNGARKAAGTHPQKVMDFFRDPPMRAVLVCSVVVSVAWEVGNLLIPVYCASVKLSPSDIGWVLGSFSAASFAVRLLMPYLMRHMREWIMIALTLLISALAFVLFPFFESQLPLMACAFLLGLGLGGVASEHDVACLSSGTQRQNRRGDRTAADADQFKQGDFPGGHGCAGGRDWCRSVPVGTCHFRLSGLSFCDAIGADGYRCGGRQSHGTLTDI